MTRPVKEMTLRVGDFVRVVSGYRQGQVVELLRVYDESQWLRTWCCRKLRNGQEIMLFEEKLSSPLDPLEVLAEAAE